MRLGPLRIQFQYRKSNSLFGRFGGGWDWKLGLQWGDSGLLINLLLCDIRFDWKPRKFKVAKKGKD